VLFEHGMDAVLGRQAIAQIGELADQPDGAYYTANLFRGIPDLLVEGIRAGQYGSSIRFAPIPGKWDRVRSPKPSDYNPEGIPEVTIREARVQEFSVVTFPQYDGATAGIRSLTDEVAARQLLVNPERLLEIIEQTRAVAMPAGMSMMPSGVKACKMGGNQGFNGGGACHIHDGSQASMVAAMGKATADSKRSEPQHSEREEPVDPAPERSRSTQPIRDYLKPEEAEPTWLL
jgi:hypothetical protein